MELFLKMKEKIWKAVAVRTLGVFKHVPVKNTLPQRILSIRGVDLRRECKRLIAAAVQ